MSLDGQQHEIELFASEDTFEKHDHSTEYETPRLVTRSLDFPPALKSAGAAWLQLRELREGWDGHNALPIHMEVMRRVLRTLAMTTTADTPAPQLVPTCDGGIQVEWHIYGIDLEVEFLPEGGLEVFYCASEKEEELTLRTDLTRLQGYINELTKRHSL